LIYNIDKASTCYTERRIAKEEAREEEAITANTVSGPMPATKSSVVAPNPDLLFRIMDPRIRIRKKYLRIHKTARKLDSPTLDLVEGPKRKSVAFLPVAEEGASGLLQTLR
jgi:hypothetical protein